VGHVRPSMCHLAPQRRPQIHKVQQGLLFAAWTGTSLQEFGAACALAASEVIDRHRHPPPSPSHLHSRVDPLSKKGRRGQRV
jgi:hypothetical protein